MPEMRSWLVSFSVKSRSEAPSQWRYRSPRAGWLAWMTLAPAAPSTCFRSGRLVPCSSHQVLRNQSVGSRCRVASSGPRFQTVIRTRISSGESFAYSTKTSK